MRAKEINERKLVMDDGNDVDPSEYLVIVEKFKRVIRYAQKEGMNYETIHDLALQSFEDSDWSDDEQY